MASVQSSVTLMWLFNFSCGFLATIHTCISVCWWEGSFSGWGIPKEPLQVLLQTSNLKLMSSWIKICLVNVRSKEPSFSSICGRLELAQRILQGYFRRGFHVWICYVLVLESSAEEYKECKASWGVGKSSFHSAFWITLCFQEVEKWVACVGHGMDHVKGKWFL